MKITEAIAKGSTTSEQLLLAAMLPIINIFETEYIDEVNMSNSKYFQRGNREKGPLYQYNVGTKKYDGSFQGGATWASGLNSLKNGASTVGAWLDRQNARFSPAAYTRAYMFYKAVCKENVGNGITAEWVSSRLGPDNEVTMIQPYYIPRMISNAFYGGYNTALTSAFNSRGDILSTESDDAKNSDWIEVVKRIRETGISTKEDQEVVYQVWADWGIMLDDYFPNADIGIHDIDVEQVVGDIIEEAKKAQEELKSMDRDQKSIFMQMRKRICSLGGQFVLLSQADFATVKAAFEELFPGEVVEPIAPKPRAPRKRKTQESYSLVSEFMKL